MRIHTALLRALFHLNMGALLAVLAWLGIMFLTVYRAMPQPHGNEIKLVPMSCSCVRAAQPIAPAPTRDVI